MHNHSDPVHKVIRLTANLAALGSLALFAGQTSAQPANYEPGSISAEIEVTGAIDKVFPLFTPQGETLWIPGWNPEFVHPKSGEAQPGALALTSSHVNPDMTSYWYTTVYDTDQYVTQHVNVDPGELVLQVDIACWPGSTANSTLVKATFTFLPLSEGGDTFVQRQFSEESWQAMMNSWVGLIEYGLEHGEPMPPPEEHGD